MDGEKREEGRAGWGKGVRRGEEEQEKGEKEWKMRDEDGGASDIIAQAAVATCLSRIFEMGTECEHGASVTPRILRVCG